MYIEYVQYTYMQIIREFSIVRNKSLILEFPNIDEKLYPHLLRGYFDGDGSLYQYVKNENNKRITLTFTSTEQFCKKIKEIVEKNLVFIVVFMMHHVIME